MNERMERAQTNSEVNPFGVSRKEFEAGLLTELPILRKSAFSLAGQQEAEDLLQDTLARASANFNRYNPHAPREKKEGSQLGAWVYTIMLNLYLDAGRKETRRRRLQQDPAFEIPFTRGDHDADKVLELKQVLELFPELKPEHRAVLELVALDYDQEYIAAKLGIEVGTVKSRLSRARAVLKALLQAKAQGNTES
jgi:RNA polymerase sigma-70 factor (ECF subfamily)